MTGSQTPLPQVRRRHILAVLTAALSVGAIIGGCPGPTPPPPRDPQILIFEDVDTSGGTGSLVLDASDKTPVAGDIIVATGGGGLLRKVNAVSTNSDGSLSVQVAAITIAEAAQNGDFTFTDGPTTAKQRATAKTWHVLTFGADLDRTLYDRSGVSVQTAGDFSFDVTLDLDIQVRDARIRYFKSAIQGSADFELDGDIEALAGVVAETGDISLWSGSQYLYGYIGVPPFGLPVVIEARAQLVAGGTVEASGTASVASGIAASSFIRLGAEYRSESGWSGISEQGLDFGYDAPTWCLEGELGARVYVRPTLELMFYTVAGPNFDVEPYLEYTASAYACGGGGQQPSGAYDWELVAGAAAHAKVRVDILDLYMIESPTLTVFDVRRTLASGHGDGSIDSDGDGVPDDQDGCPNDPDKTAPGNCGCGNPETPGCAPCDPPAQALSPSPGNGATGIATSADLDWANASGATSYDVYFGTDSTPDSGEYQGNTGSSSWSLPALAESTTYYWRINTINDCGTTTGVVWSFTTTGGGPSVAWIYFTDSGTDSIRRVRADGTGLSTLVTGQEAPYGIAVDISAGKVYWTDLNADAVRRANLDGSGAEKVVFDTSLFNSPTGLAVDPSGNRIYWLANNTSVIPNKQAIFGRH